DARYSTDSERSNDTVVNVYYNASNKRYKVSGDARYSTDTERSNATINNDNNNVSNKRYKVSGDARYSTDTERSNDTLINDNNNASNETYKVSDDVRYSSDTERSNGTVNDNNTVSIQKYEVLDDGQYSTDTERSNDTAYNVTNNVSNIKNKVSGDIGKSNDTLNNGTNVVSNIKYTLNTTGITKNTIKYNNGSLNDNETEKETIHLIDAILSDSEITDETGNINGINVEVFNGIDRTTTATLSDTEKNARIEGNSSVSPISVADKCENQCSKQDPYGEIWNGCPGILVVQDCPYGAFGQAMWRCDSNGGEFVGDMPDYSDCAHIWLYELIYYIILDDDALWIARQLEKHAHETSLFGHELDDLLEVLNSTFDLHVRQMDWFHSPNIRLEKSSTFTQLTTSVMDKILQNKIGMLQLKEYQLVSLGLLLTNLSIQVGFALASLAAACGQDFKYNATFNDSQSMVFGVDVLDEYSDNSYLVFPSNEGYDRRSHITVNFNSNGQLKRPRSVGMLLDSEPASMLFPPSRNKIVENCTRSKILNSDVISFTLQDEDNNSVRIVEELTHRSTGYGDSVRILLKHRTIPKGPINGIIRRNLHPGEKASAVLGSAR
ncbi:hypothetical protein L9F63_018168, partial [Diploptera punctata]